MICRRVVQTMALPIKPLSSAAKGYGYRWQKAREQWLAEHSACVECRKGGRVVRATVVDHVIAHRLGDALASGDAEWIARARRLFWDRGNWQSLCKPCHDSWKQRVEKSGEPGCDESGIPKNASHHWHGQG